MSTPKILIVDDEPELQAQLSRWLGEEGYRTDQATSGRAALAAISKTNFTVVLLDLNLPDIGGLELLEILHADYPDTCVIVLSAFDELLTKARKAGAFDFFEKPLNFVALVNRIEAAIQQFRLQRESFYQHEEARRQYQLDKIIGNSEAMRRLFDLIRKVADSQENILIEGESGTGKELIARAIHYNSARKHRPLLIANCAALSESLVESELFGHEKGAFTGAHARRIGKFERAHETTLLVDEVGDLSPKMQLKFLRFLQEGTIERLAGEEAIEVDVRVIAATNMNLAEAVAQGSFRQDLFFRLNRILVTVPPLRQRKGDIPLLVDHFINMYNRRNGKSIQGLSKSALRLLEDYHFPGNVRELENLIASAIVLEEGEVIRPTTIRPRLVLSDSVSSLDFHDLPYKEAKDNFERIYFSQLLERCNYNVSQTARLAQMDRSHVITKLKTLGIKDAKRAE